LRRVSTSNRERENESNNNASNNTQSNTLGTSQSSRQGIDLFLLLKQQLVS
jgi:hypothetical protein